MSSKIFGSLKTPQGITPQHVVGAAGGAVLSSAIAYGVDKFLEKGLGFQLPPKFPMIAPDGYKLWIIRDEPKRVTRSAIAGLCGTIPTEIIGADLYMKSPSAEARNVAVGMMAGGAISLLGWIIRGIVYDQQGKDPQFKILPKAKTKSGNFRSLNYLKGDEFKSLKFGSIRVR